MKGKVDKLLGRYREKDGEIIIGNNNSFMEMYANNETELINAFTLCRASGKSARIYIVGSIILTANRDFLIPYGQPQISFVGLPVNTIITGPYEFNTAFLTLENLLVSTSTPTYINVNGGYINLKNITFLSESVYSPTQNLMKTHIHVYGTPSNGTGSVDIDKVQHYSETSVPINTTDDIQPIVIDNSAFGFSNLYVSVKNVNAKSSFNRFSKLLLLASTSTIFKVSGDTSWYFHPAQLMPGSGTIAATSELLKNSSIDNARVDYMPTDTTLEFITGISALKQLRQISKADFLADVNLKLLESNAYGVRYDTTAAATTCTRIGNLTNHILLPIQNKIKRCLLDDAGNMLSYLKNDNSLLKPDGTAATLDGTSGQVMVEIPDFYYKSWSDGNYYNIMISEYAITGYTKISKHYIGAFKAGLQRSSLKLGSFINLGTDFRGGNNNSAWDAAANTLLGKPATLLSLTNFRNYARNRGARWQAMPFSAKTAFNILYLVEYANRNSQAAFNAALTAEGYKQGGLGDGVTNVNSTNWNIFSTYYPIIPTGKTITLGNASGSVNHTVVGFTGGDITVPVNSYRGIENPFGDIWEWCDGVLFNVQAADSGAQSIVYVCDLPANYADTITGNYRQVGLLSRVSGYITKAIGGSECILLPAESSGGSSSTFFPDYLDQSIPATGSAVRGLLVSANATNGASAGLWFAIASSTPANATANVGSRVCFL